MGTVHMPPIDLYTETQDDRDERWANMTPEEIQTPRENGDVDEPALRAGELQLERVLGW